jgi:flagellar motor protein MotB
MRGAVRRRHEEDEESAFVSMTDLTVSFLFIIILLLAFFASQFRTEDVVSRSRYDAVVAQRDDMEQERDVLEVELNSTRTQLEQVTAERDAALEELAQLRAQVVDLEATVARQDGVILELNARVAELLAKIAQLETDMEKLRQRIAELESMLKVENPLEQYGASATDVRRKMLDRLAKAVQSDIQLQQIEGLTVTAQGDALRFQGSGLFASGARSLTGSSLQIVRLLGEHLDRELGCFSVGPRSSISDKCNPNLVLFETIQVEGHTDSDGGNVYNLDLSAGRALSAFTAIAPDVSSEGSAMLGYENLLGQPLLAFAGYGEMRPIVDESIGDRSANRRIDLRFIMYVPPGADFIPQNVSDLEKIGEALRNRANDG